MSAKRWDELLRRLDTRRPSNVAEVGVWQGKMSMRLLRAAPHMTLYMIDRWAKPPADDSYAHSGSEISERPQALHDVAYKKCVGIANAHKGRAHIIKSDSAAAADRYADGFFDIVFIDGDHSYEGCQRDIVAWRSKVRSGGWIGGHDYAHPDQGEVKRAVDQLFRTVILGDNRTWWVRM